MKNEVKRFLFLWFFSICSKYRWHWRRKTYNIYFIYFSFHNFRWIEIIIISSTNLWCFILFMRLIIVLIFFAVTLHHVCYLNRTTCSSSCLKTIQNIISPNMIYTIIILMPLNKKINMNLFCILMSIAAEKLFFLQFWLLKFVFIHLLFSPLKQPKIKNPPKSIKILKEYSSWEREINQIFF